MVKKANQKWRMCVDFSDLNKACPKDSYPLSRVNILVDSIAIHQLLSFMDAFSGYNQIKLDEADQEKTSFITSQGLFCYKVMMFDHQSRYDNSGKLMKQTSFKVKKNLRGNLPEKKFIIVKRSLRSSTKLLSLNSTIPIDELTTETFYRFRTSELFNI